MESWGRLRHASSHLVRKASAWVTETTSLQRLVRWVGAFPLCLMVELRFDQGTPELEAAIRRELREVLRPNEVEQVGTARAGGGEVPTGLGGFGAAGLGCVNRDTRTMDADAR